MRKMTYAKAGVDINLENRSIDAMKSVLTTKRKGFGAAMTKIGHYAGLLDMGSFALAMTTDGVGIQGSHRQRHCRNGTLWALTASL